MCAINGITKVDRDLVAQMNEVTKHRGPDGTGLWSDEGITLGHNRLSIIDLDKRASQPMHSNDGRYAIVFNGEIYNYRELKEELKESYEFKTESDTEVLLVAYNTWGEHMFPKLKGIFAFGIWDKETKTLTLARDHMGVKPLYYAMLGDTLIFSSEIPGILEGIDDRRLNQESLAFYLSMEYVPGPETLIKGVKKMRPGEMLRFQGGTLTTTSFLEQTPKNKESSHADIYHSIDTAVKRQLVSDRPVGAYLSGGFDSSIVVHHMTKHTPHTRTYSVDFEVVEGQEGDSSKFNADAQLAKKTAKFFNTEHKTLTITLDDVRNNLESIIAGANEPIANSTAITQHLLSDFVRKDGTIVVLGGDGGDELFGGYTRHKIASAAYLYQQLPKALQSLGGALHPKFRKLRTPFGTPFHRLLMAKDETKLAVFLKHNLGSDNIISNYFDSAYANIAPQNFHNIDAFMRVDRFTWLPDECFIRSDFASMAHGVELRVPFVDTDVVALSDNISIWRKTLPHEGKRVIRKTYKKHLPPYLYTQPKRGWLSPAAKWFRDPVIHSFMKNTFSSKYYDGLDEIFDWDAIHTLLDAHVAKEAYHLYPLWNILVLQIWARKHKVRL